MMFLLSAALALCAGCAGGSSSGRIFSRAGFEDELAVEGSIEFPANVAGYEIAVDPGLRIVYLAGQMGQTGMVRIDVADPANMTATAFAPGFGGGVAVDPVTHRVATTDAYGATLGIFEPSGATYDAQPLAGCGGQIAGGEGGLFGVSTQCVDTLHIYDETQRRIVFQPASGGVASSVVFNAATGRFYQNRTPGRGGRTDALAVAPLGGGRYLTSDFPIDGFVWAADPVRNTVWFADDYGAIAQPAGGMFLLDGTTHAVIGPTAVTRPANVAIAQDIGRAYLRAQDGLLRLLDPTTGAQLYALDLSALAGASVAGGAVTLATDGQRAYVPILLPASPPRLYVIGPRPRR